MFAEPMVQPAQPGLSAQTSEAAQKRPLEVSCPPSFLKPGSHQHRIRLAVAFSSLVISKDGGFQLTVFQSGACAGSQTALLSLHEKRCRGAVLAV